MLDSTVRVAGHRASTMPLHRQVSESTCEPGAELALALPAPLPPTDATEAAHGPEDIAKGLTGAAGTPTHLTPLRRLEAPRPNRCEEVSRDLTNLVIHLGLSDGPNILGMMANCIALPPSLAPLVTASNLVNTLTGIPALLADVREMRGTFKNPLATRTDRQMDLLHFVAGDVLSTAGSLLPFVANMSDPVTMGIYLGTQISGLVFDLAKTGYDLYRHGQQSAWREGQAALASAAADGPAHVPAHVPVSGHETAEHASSGEHLALHPPPNDVARTSTLEPLE